MRWADRTARRGRSLAVAVWSEFSAGSRATKTGRNPAADTRSRRAHALFSWHRPECGFTRTIKRPTRKRAKKHQACSLVEQ
jgi:hypothetical protein